MIVREDTPLNVLWVRYDADDRNGEFDSCEGFPCSIHFGRIRLSSAAHVSFSLRIRVGTEFFFGVMGEKSGKFRSENRERWLSERLRGEGTRLVCCFFPKIPCL